MRTAKDVYADYEDDVAFIAVDVDPSESVEMINAYAAAQGYTWEMAEHHGDVMSAFGVTGQPSKIIIDGDGVITVRQLGRTLSADGWRDALDAVTA